MTGPRPATHLAEVPDWHPPRRQVGPYGADQLAAFGRWVLAMHQPRPMLPGQMPQCACGAALVLCPYRRAAARYLGPPRRDLS